MNERERLSALLSGFMPTQLVYVMARLRIADLLDGDSLTVAELSSLTATKAHLLRRLQNPRLPAAVTTVRSSNAPCRPCSSAPVAG
jgi:hypothetical protein